MAKLFSPRLRALIGKEFHQIRRDRRLAVSLIVPPTVQLLLFGFALSASVSNVRLGAVDESATPESRELLAAFSQSKSFRLVSSYGSVDQLSADLQRGAIDAALVIPYDYDRLLQRGRNVNVQFLVNAMNANTAAISQGYAEGIIQTHNIDLRTRRSRETPGQVQVQAAYLYNPGLEDSWFIVTGVFGLLIILNSSLVASGAMVREREAGTIEQLLMSPASTTEIILAKIAPLFVLLFLMSLFAITLMKLAFHVPFQGNLLLVIGGAALCILSGISIGTVNATFSRSAQQAQLTNFFINPPLASLSGALNPVEAMPNWLQPVTLVNPITHFATIVRSTLLKGSGIETLWPNFLALLAFTVVLVWVSVWRFRKQLS